MQYHLFQFCPHMWITSRMRNWRKISGRKRRCSRSRDLLLGGAHSLPHVRQHPHPLSGGFGGLPELHSSYRTQSFDLFRFDFSSNFLLPSTVQYRGSFGQYEKVVLKLKNLNAPISSQSEKLLKSSSLDKKALLSQYLSLNQRQAGLFTGQCPARRGQNSVRTSPAGDSSRL